MDTCRQSKSVAVWSSMAGSWLFAYTVGRVAQSPSVFYKYCSQYYKRGFQPFVVDPFCYKRQHNTTCAFEKFRAMPSQTATSEDENGDTTTAFVDSLDPVAAQRREITRFQRQNQDKLVFVCCGSRLVPYSLAAFEKEEGEALDYFSKVHKFDKNRILEEHHPWLIKCCRNCRFKYETYAFVKRNPEYADRITSEYPEREMLSGPSYRRQDIFDSVFSPSFYSGGVFDGRRNRYKPGYVDSVLQRLESQLDAERARYFYKHDTYNGYKKRFVYSTDVNDLFDSASELIFEGSKRNPVGLNPERFIATCNSCRQWLVGHEHGSEYCEGCQNKKPKAK